MNPLSHPSQLPSVDRIMQSDPFLELSQHYGRPEVLSKLRAQIDHIRTTLTLNSAGKNQPGDTSSDVQQAKVIDYLHAQIAEALQQDFAPSLQRVVNLTGTVLHTNLGRAPYPPEAIDAMIKVTKSACNLEFDLAKGVRGRRDDHVEKWICKLTGAEAATTVNNNAAAVLLTLNSIANKKQVIVSRGELIEIGGSFRVPAIMKKAGCKLREVGTTNRTHLNDYENAIGKKTAAMMKVHTSNYEINGFTKSVDATALAEIAKAHNIPLIDDLGSGTLTDLSVFGLPYERTAKEALSDGADIITFSGDKLLGGPQCGVIAGRADLVKQIEKNPMKRAMRLDKVTLAALEAVLKLYGDQTNLAASIPSLGILSRSGEEIKQTADQLSSVLKPLLPDLQVSVQSCESQIGSGALPTRTINSFAVVIEGNAVVSANTLASKFRALPLPIVGRVSHNSLWLDCRTLRDEFAEVCGVLKDALSPD